MFKFLKNRWTIRMLAENLSAFNPMSPYDDRHYRYHFEGNIFHFYVKFPFHKELNEKYHFLYNKETEEFTLQPNDINVRIGSRSYRKLKKALQKAYKHSIERTAFYDMIIAERKKYPNPISNNHSSSSSSDSADKKNRHSSPTRRSSGCTPSMRDAIISSFDDSGRSSSGNSRGGGCD